MLFNKQVDRLGRFDLDGPLQKLLQVHHFGLSGEFEVKVLLIVIYRHADLSPVFFGVRLHLLFNYEANNVSRQSQLMEWHMIDIDDNLV